MHSPVAISERWPCTTSLHFGFRKAGQLSRGPGRSVAVSPTVVAGIFSAGTTHIYRAGPGWRRHRNLNNVADAKAHGDLRRGTGRFHPRPTGRRARQERNRQDCWRILLWPHSWVVVGSRWM